MKHSKLNLYLISHSSFFHLDDIVAPIDSTNINSQLLDKISWTASNNPAVNPNGITASVQINDRNCQHGLGYENTPMDTSEQLSSLSSHPSHV